MKNRYEVTYYSKALGGTRWMTVYAGNEEEAAMEVESMTYGPITVTDTVDTSDEP